MFFLTRDHLRRKHFSYPDPDLIGPAVQYRIRNRTENAYNSANYIIRSVPATKQSLFRCEVASFTK
jgi:hypothetical protein